MNWFEKRAEKKWSKRREKAAQDMEAQCKAIRDGNLKRQAIRERYAKRDCPFVQGKCTLDECVFWCNRVFVTEHYGPMFVPDGYVAHLGLVGCKLISISGD